MVYQFTYDDRDRQNISAGKLPVYLQIAEQISREISAGLLIDGQRLPSERELAIDYGVAVRTLRKSLARLTEMGLLTRKHGSGNYIRKNENTNSIYSFFRLELPQGSGFPSAHMLDIRSLKKPNDLPDFGYSSHGHRFRRQRFSIISLLLLKKSGLTIHVHRIFRLPKFRNLYINSIENA